MYINSIASYVPPIVVSNRHFETTCGISDEWIRERTGIVERRKCAPGENTNTMAWKVVTELLSKIKSDGQDYDLIVAATYTPFDTVVTLAHYVQKNLGVKDIPTISLSTACSSVLNAIEIVEGYFALNKASKALVIGSENNSAYYDDYDRISGPLWGDGAVAFSITKERESENDYHIKHIHTGGAAASGKATEAVYLQPAHKEFRMPIGKDVFLNACEYMSRESKKTLDKFDLSINEIDYFIPHQANHRISLHVAKDLELDESKLIANIQRYGNTGCCGFGIGLAENQHLFKKGHKLLVSVFGGGYSFGTMLIEV